MPRTANEEDELEDPCEALEAVPAVETPAAELDLPPVPADELLLDEELLVDVALVVPVPETVSPISPETETIVPFSGAYILAFCTACSSLSTVSLSLLTAALAEARLASRVAALCFVLEELVPWLLPFVGEVAVDSVVFVDWLEPPDFEVELGLEGVVVVALGVGVFVEAVVVAVGVVEVSVAVLGLPVDVVGVAALVGVASLAAFATTLVV